MQRHAACSPASWAAHHCSSQPAHQPTHLSKTVLAQLASHGTPAPPGPACGVSLRATASAAPRPLPGVGRSSPSRWPPLCICICGWRPPAAARAAPPWRTSSAASGYCCDTSRPPSEPPGPGSEEGGGGGKAPADTANACGEGSTHDAASAETQRADVTTTCSLRPPSAAFPEPSRRGTSRVFSWRPTGTEWVGPRGVAPPLPGFPGGVAYSPAPFHSRFKGGSQRARRRTGLWGWSGVASGKC